MHGTESAVAVRREAPAADNLQQLLSLCLDCARACLRCADECLAADDPQQLSRCLQLSLDCADRCFALAPVPVAKDSATMGELLTICAEACERAAVECRKQGARHQHCRLCAEICERCGEACRTAAPALAA